MCWLLSFWIVCKFFRSFCSPKIPNFFLRCIISQKTCVHRLNMVKLKQKNMGSNEFFLFFFETACKPMSNKTATHKLLRKIRSHSRSLSLSIVCLLTICSFSSMYAPVDVFNTGTHSHAQQESLFGLVMWCIKKTVALDDCLAARVVGICFYFFFFFFFFIFFSAFSLLLLLRLWWIYFTSFDFVVFRFD